MNISRNKIEYKTEYDNYKDYFAVMISTDRNIWNERSAVRSRMVEQAKDFKELHIIIFGTISNSRKKEEKISNNCTIYSTNSYTKFHYINGAYKVGRKILKTIPKTEKLLVTCQDPFETGLAGKKIAALRNDSELLLQIHTDLYSPYFTSKNIGIKNAILNKIRLFISNFTLPQAQVIRVVSRKIADSLVERRIDHDKIIVKPIKVDTNFISNTDALFILKDKFPQFKKIILIVSRLESEKNIEMAIQAMKIIDQQISGIGMIIVGSGSLMNKLKKMVYSLNLSQKIVFEGWQTDLLPYYKGSDVLLVTSWYEGYGVVFKEAHALNLKIVSTDVGIAREVGAEIVGWDVNAIVDGINKILK